MKIEIEIPDELVISFTEVLEQIKKTSETIKNKTEEKIRNKDKMFEDMFNSVDEAFTSFGSSLDNVFGDTREIFGTMFEDIEKTAEKTEKPDFAHKNLIRRCADITDDISKIDKTASISFKKRLVFNDVFEYILSVESEKGQMNNETIIRYIMKDSKEGEYFWNYIIEKIKG